jgi:hypothetical protein
MRIDHLAAIATSTRHSKLDSEQVDEEHVAI